MFGLMVVLGSSSLPDHFTFSVGTQRLRGMWHVMVFFWDWPWEKGTQWGQHCGEVNVVGRTIEHTWAFDVKC
jgi:hypothetical protein